MIAPRLSPYRVQGYPALVSSIPVGPPASVILCALSVEGEGAFITERLMQDPRRLGVVLRGTKVLSSDDWAGLHYRNRFSTPAEVDRFLQSVPIDYVVLDAAPTRPDQALLRDALNAAPIATSPPAHFLIKGSGGAPDSTLWVYRNRIGRPPGPRTLELDMGPTHGHTVLRETLDR